MNEKITSEIENVNKQFKKATKAQKRVMIAQDVLAQLRARRYTAKSGVWVDPKYAKNSDISVFDSVQTLFADKTIEKCNVCALGGLFMSCTNLNNTTTVEDLEDEASYDLGFGIEHGNKLPNGLNNIFSKSQLKLIEKYYEGGNGYFTTYKDSDEFYSHLFGFYTKHTPTRRLEKIMENIVANNGTFVPKGL